LHTGCGGCADFVRGVIEKAAGKRIANLGSVFNHSTREITHRVLISNYDEFMESINNGDILCVAHSDSENAAHYMLFCNVITESGQRHCLGVNGGYEFASVAFKGVIASRITANDFYAGGYFVYDKRRNPDNSLMYPDSFRLYRVDYDLE